MQKLLIIDDDDNWQKTLRVLLKLKGFEVFSAPDGIRGIELARAELPDLILSDVNMPGPTGLEALGIIRGDPLTSHIPVILMTGEEETLMRRAMELGADDFLVKPVPLMDLLKAVEARLLKQQVLRQAADKKLADLHAFLSLKLPGELTAPLARITEHSELLESCAAELPPAQVAELARGIQAGARAMKGLIRNFLLHAQLEMTQHNSGEIAALRSKRTLNLSQVLQHTARAVAEEFGRPADLQLHLVPGHAEIGKDFVVKITEELLANAFAHSPAGTPVKLANRQISNFEVLEFSDQGCGMTAAQVQALAAYVRHDSGPEARPGLGLGLAITRKLAELHGGVLTIKSQPGKGTTVAVMLPAQLQQFREPAPV